MKDFHAADNEKENGKTAYVASARDHGSCLDSRTRVEQNLRMPNRSSQSANTRHPAGLLAKEQLDFKIQDAFLR